MNANQKPAPTSVVRQLSLPMPLAEAIRARLVGKEFADLRRTTHGPPYIEARTEQGNSILAYLEDGLYTLETEGDEAACHPAAGEAVAVIP